jgi:maltooligosyltrehalose trehalohydrolase
MGEESGETNPFLYFVSHEDPALIEAVREGRRRELEWAPGEAVPDPADAETFHRSRVDWAAAGRAPARRANTALYRDLLRLRATEPALRPGAAMVVEHDPGSSWVSVALSVPPAAPRAATFNFSAAPVAAPLPPAPWRLVLATADARYGGPEGAAAAGAAVTLPPWSAALCRAEAG